MNDGTGNMPRMSGMGPQGSKPNAPESSKPVGYSSDTERGTHDNTLGDDLAALKETVAGLVSSMGSGAASTIRETGQTIANAASGALDASASAASYAGDQAKTMANDLEAFARRNPLGAMGGALAIGVLIGMLGRGRH